MTQTKRVIVWSSARVTYSTEMEVPINASEGEIKDLFMDQAVFGDELELEELDSADFQVNEIEFLEEESNDENK